MPFATVTVPVRASVDTLWSLLLDKVERPDASGVQNCEIFERDGNTLMRRIKTRTLETVERVRIDPATATIKYTVLDHPHLMGYVMHQLTESETDGAIDLSFTIDMTPKNPDHPDDHDLTPVLTAAAEEMRAMAESTDGAHGPH